MKTHNTEKKIAVHVCCNFTDWLFETNDTNNVKPLESVNIIHLWLL